MTISIADAVTQIMAQAAQAPVILIDTCSFVDLFRRDERRAQPRLRAQEVRAAADLLDFATTFPDRSHLVVPELIPGECADHANREEAYFRKWTSFHDENQTWVFDVSTCVALILPAPQPIGPHDLATKLRTLADSLLAKAKVLARDQGCLERAVDRLISKKRPSHNREMKDSMNLEQCLELSRRLQIAGFVKSRVWVSSNTNDFAQESTSSQLHADLRDEFTAAGLKYFTSLRAALGHLGGLGEI